MAWLAAIVGGFTMTAPVEFTYSDPDAPMALVTAYALCTALVPSLMIVAAMIAVFVLGAVLRMGKLFVHEREEEEFLASARCFALNRAVAGNRTMHTAPPAALRSFDRFWDLRCESDWRLTFRLFSAGITFFFPLLSTMAFLKFYPNAWIPSIFSCILLWGLIQWFFLLRKWGQYLTSPLPSSPSSSSHPPPHTSVAPHSTHASLLMHAPRPAIANHPIDWHIRPLPLLPPSGDDPASSPTHSGNSSDYAAVYSEPSLVDASRYSFEHVERQGYGGDEEIGATIWGEGGEIGLPDVTGGHRQLELMQVSGLLEGVVRGVDFDDGEEDIEFVRA
ncbi:hypothetical protein CLOM_g4003 [Closterium sp. NIES-68]|nr:hypothetical protein CLOM_g4003 [Closterium sp. NIES-68]GJP83243.1 hypothetical protein CLOP_g13416 [Closterium sp. NIES-67]